MSRLRDWLGVRRLRDSEGLIALIGLGVFAVAAIELFAGALSIGISTDEPTHVLRLQSWIDNGWYLPDFFLVDGEPGTDAGIAVFSHGPAFAVLVHAVAVVAGIEAADGVSVSSAGWAARHLAVAALGLATSVTVGAVVRSLTGSRSIAIWSAAALLVIPLWMGMSFFNPKDIPPAAGYTFATAGLVLALGNWPDPGRKRLRALLVGGLVAAGAFLAVGTRPALWLPIALAVLAWAGLTLLRARVSDDSRHVVAVATGLAAGLLALVVVYPAAFSDPAELLSGSLSDSSDYPWTGVTLTGGRLLSENPPWWYLPAWGFASTPLLILLTAMAGLIASAVSGIHTAMVHGRLRLDGLAARGDLGVFLVVLQVLLLPVASIVVGASMYTGFRQHIYVLPALAALAGIGAAYAWNRWGRSGAGPAAGRHVVTAVLCLGLLVPLAEGLMLFPYNYAYVNPVAGIGGVNGRWETDYWWTSSREALSRVPADAEPLCAEQLIPRQIPGWDIFPVDCATLDQFAPYLNEQGESSGPDAAPEGSTWVIAKQRSDGLVPDYCRVAEDVTRPLRGEQVVMARILLCDTDRIQRLDEAG